MEAIKSFFSNIKYKITLLLSSISWSKVNSLGKMKFSRTSYYYLVIIPVLVKALEKVNNPFHLQIEQNKIELNLELPFSWYLFYFGALSIALGSILYQIYCPNIIKDFKNYGEFLDAKASDNLIIESAIKNDLNFPKELLEKPVIKNIISKKDEVKSKQPSWFSFVDEEYTRHSGLDELYNKDIVVDYKHNIEYQEAIKNLFNNLYKVLNESKKNLKVLTISFYIIGFLCFIWVIIQNILFVIKHLLF